MLVLKSIVLNSQSLRVFSCDTYVPHDDLIKFSASEMGYPNYNYRPISADYCEYVSHNLFYYANNPNSLEINKPFVFVEGISFNKLSVNEGRSHYDEYFFQTRNRASDKTLQNEGIINTMAIPHNPGNNILLATQQLIGQISLP